MYATLWAATIACLKSSTVAIFGARAPVFTATPTPTFASEVTLAASTTPCSASGFRPPGVRTRTSKASPPAMRLDKAPAVSFSTTTLLPVRASNVGAMATTICLKAPLVSTLMVSAWADTDASASAGTARDNRNRRMGISLFAG
jgi:hypothetical protein